MRPFLLLLLISCASLSTSQIVHLDQTFGDSGMVIHDLDHSKNYQYREPPLDVAIASDGKIAVVGRSSKAPFFVPDFQFTVIRNRHDGFLDSTFADSGIVKMEFGFLSHPQAAGVTVQPDGKILVSGYYGTDVFGSFSIATSILVRFNEDGSLDSTFENDGKVIIGDDYYFEFTAFDVFVQPDGKILSVGGGGIALKSHWLMVAKYTGDGKLDSSFSDDGMAEIDSLNANHFLFDAFFSVKADADGKIVAAGAVDGDLIIVRLQENGELDPSFGNGGILKRDFGGNDSGRSLALLPDGSILVAAESDDQAVLVKCKPDGSFDPSFSTDGILLTTYLDTPPGDWTDFNNNNLAVLENGRIVLVGRKGDDFAIVIFEPDGNLHSLAFDDFGNLNEAWTAVAVQEDGKMVTAGYTGFPGSEGDVYWVVARYLPELNVGIFDRKAASSSLLIYPNPVVESSTLKYTLLDERAIDILLFNAQGKLVQTFLEGASRTAGEHEEQLELDAELVSGTYFLVLQSGLERVSIKISKQ